MFLTVLTTICVCYNVVLPAKSLADTAKTNPKDSVIELKGVTIKGNNSNWVQVNASQSRVQINSSYLESHFAGSLMQTLDNLPGVKAMAIGSGQSKPLIRGMGFNRMAVIENGIKHESQQWGDDHGLEINQFDIDKVEIIKGPSALLYGSDAIGGVLNLYSNYAPKSDLEAKILLFTHSNNKSIGFATKIGQRKNRFFYFLGLSMLDYADYRVTADSIQYYSYRVALKSKRLRNTAGTERNGNLMFGYFKGDFQTNIKISNNNSKNGFFANAHGLEVRLSDIDYDKSVRDVNLPYQSVNHFKIINHTAWSKGSLLLESNLAYQNNIRKEYSEPVSHGYMPQPSGTLERKFNKDTYSAHIGVKKYYSTQNYFQIGANLEQQSNKIGGWGFIIPNFRALNIGSFLFNQIKMGQNIIINEGIRYDYANIDIDSYTDWYKTPMDNQDSVYKQRSINSQKQFNSFTWSLGVNYHTDNWIFKLNLGKSFRIPIAKELGADGINYHIFRYEKGNNNLSPEQSYQLDFAMQYNNKRWEINIEPFINYFPNYIYLNPTAKYTEGLQTYYYTQAKVFRYGFEIQLLFHFNEKLETELKSDYLYSVQLSGDKKGYTLPFSVPSSADFNVKYTLNNENLCFVTCNIRVVDAQKEIVPPEKITDGYWLLNASLTKHFCINRYILKMILQAKNILNKHYYNHTSFYRLMDIPEAGLNIMITLGFEF